MVDVPSLGVGADEKAGDAQAVAEPVDLRRYDVVVEAAPVVPAEEDRGRVPRRPAGDRVDEARDVVLARAHGRRWVLAVGTVGHDPRHRREGAEPRVDIEVVERRDVTRLPVVLDRVEIRERVPDAGRVRRLQVVRAHERIIVVARRYRAAVDVVGPADVVVVEQLRDVGPCVDRSGSGWVTLVPLPVRGKVGPLDRRRAAHGVVRRALRGPTGHHHEVDRFAPRRDRLEHVVLEHEPLRIRPVVRDLACVVVAHDVATGAVGRAGRCVGVVAVALRPDGLADESVHPPTVNVGARAGHPVRSAVVDVAVVVVRLDASTARVGEADPRLAVLHRNAVGAGKSAEVAVEGAVFLHHDDDVLDLVQADVRAGLRAVHRRGGDETTDEGGQGTPREQLSHGSHP